MTAECTTMERISKAMGSSNLAQDDLRQTDVDVIGALGCVGAKHRGATAVARLDMTLSANDVPAALVAAKDAVRYLAIKRGWVLTPRKIAVIATLAIKHQVAPACPECHGRSFTGMAKEGGRQGVAKPCAPCRGTGIAPIAGEFAAEAGAVVARLQQLAGQVEGRVRARLRDKVPGLQWLDIDHEDADAFVQERAEREPLTKAGADALKRWREPACEK